MNNSKLPLLATNVKRLLRVSIIGAPNAGKSTLLNRFVDTNISCVSGKVHTTRSNVLGVFTDNDTQLEFYDTPGLITRHHLLKHRLEDSFYTDPQTASRKCDLIAVLVDASNIREQKRLNKGILNTLAQHQDKQSILILNKVDLVKDKRALLDIGTRLTQGCINGKLTINKRELKKLPYERLKELNLTGHLDANKSGETDDDDKITRRTKNKYVIELDEMATDTMDDSLKRTSSFDPDKISYKKFSSVFSISALNDDGVEKLRDDLLNRALPVELWPHGPDYLTNQTTRDIVHSIIRGKVMDFVPNHIPYLVKYKYLNCSYDDMGSLHVYLTIVCPENYMLPLVIGERGVNVFRIIEDSRDIISETLKCDVKLSINVESSVNSGRRGLSK